MINPPLNQLMSRFVINIGLKEKIEVVKVVLPKAGQPRGGPIDRSAQFHGSVEESKLIAGKERLWPKRNALQWQETKLQESLGDLRQPSGTRNKTVPRLIEDLAGSQVADRAPITIKRGNHRLFCFATPHPFFKSKTVRNLESVRQRRMRRE